MFFTIQCLTPFFLVVSLDPASYDSFDLTGPGYPQTSSRGAEDVSDGKEDE
jgi:hypothetical protein